MMPRCPDCGWWYSDGTDDLKDWIKEQDDLSWRAFKGWKREVLKKTDMSSNTPEFEDCECDGVDNPSRQS